MTTILINTRKDEEGLRRLQALPDTNIRFVDPPNEDEPIPLAPDLVADVDAMLCTFPPTNVADMASLKLIQLGSAGYTQFFGLGLAERGVQACNALGVFDVPIAEWNIAMMINLLRDMRGMIRNQEEAVWDRDARFQRELGGLTVGFWGYGGIGRETARLAKAFGLRVHVLVRSGVKERVNIYRVNGTGDPEGNFPDQVFGMEQKDAFLKSLDFLIMAMPLTKRTEGIVGEDELHALKPTAYVLNPARGPLIREQALLRALREGWIAGAALDAHYHYPMPEDHPLWAMPNVIMTPHISGSALSPFYLQRVWDIFVQNVERFQKGQPLLNELTPDQLRGE